MIQARVEGRRSTLFVFPSSTAGLSDHQALINMLSPTWITRASLSLRHISQINRRDEFFLVDHIFFPHFEDSTRFLKDTIIDGELVIDVEKTGQVCCCLSSAPRRLSSWN